MELEHFIPELYFSPCHEILEAWVPAQAAPEQTSRGGIRLVCACCNGICRHSTQPSALEDANIFLVFHKAFFCYYYALSSPFPPLPTHSYVYYWGPLRICRYSILKGKICLSMSFLLNCVLSSKACFWGMGVYIFGILKSYSGLRS